MRAIPTVHLCETDKVDNDHLLASYFVEGADSGASTRQRSNTGLTETGKRQTPLGGVQPNQQFHQQQLTTVRRVQN
ncbi:hypothetical protein FQA47_020752 [Oryzias melastigma]|uniref:Uncharacterized protein n=1 Tax=Oryzias melastigma TaxID=30732 RepID=A0A834CSC3_ORYME|nr:hypothetical protein FQA47_020752 [Oryzias melastigma]